ncbi:MAG: hypothetical protein HRF44_11740 [Ignavibacterium sp.]|jgi:hypothetical protein
MKAKQNGASYETRDAHFRPLMATGFGLLGLMILILIVVWGAYEVFQDTSVQPGEFPETFAAPETTPPQPALQPNPRADMLKLRAREDSLLTGYFWIDSAAGMAAVPIDTAIQRALRQGFPVRPGEKQQ